MRLHVMDVIKLDDGNEYTVASFAIYNDVSYYYLVDLNSDDNVRFGYIDNDSFIDITDKEFLKKLIPLFDIDEK